MKNRKRGVGFSHSLEDLYLEAEKLHHHQQQLPEDLEAEHLLHHQQQLPEDLEVELLLHHQQQLLEVELPVIDETDVEIGEDLDVEDTLDLIDTGGLIDLIEEEVKLGDTNNLLKKGI